jgi:hypothetical protein
MTDEHAGESRSDDRPEARQSGAHSDTHPEPAIDPESSGDTAADLDRRRTDPMGVVLRLPSRRAFAGGTSSVTLEHPDPGAPALGPEPGAADTTDSAAGATEWSDGSDLPGETDSSGNIPEQDDPDTVADERTDWAWVEEWRAGNEPTPWATGLALTVFAALVVGVAVWVLAAGLSDRPVVAVLVNLLVAGGLAPAIWLSRGLPVLRWIGAGAAAGIVIGWISALLMLPLPTP